MLALRGTGVRPSNLQHAPIELAAAANRAWMSFPRKPRWVPASDCSGFWKRFLVAVRQSEVFFANS